MLATKKKASPPGETLESLPMVPSREQDGCGDNCGCGGHESSEDGCCGS